MAYYMLQIAYTSESCAHQIENPQNVVDRSRAVIESLGGSLESTFYAFGDYDLVQIVQFPNNVSAASLSMAVAAGGAMKTFKTTPLMTVEEGMEAFRKAGGAEYRPPL